MDWQARCRVPPKTLAVPLKLPEQKTKSIPAERHFLGRTFVSACCSQEDVMMQIGEQPLLATLTEVRPPDPDQAGDRHPNRESQLPGDVSGQSPDGVLFVSPPPLPFPRVFPGL